MVLGPARAATDGAIAAMGAVMGAIMGALPIIIGVGPAKACKLTQQH